MKKLYQNYLSTFKGLSKEIWWLSLITLINRAGTMVIPFLSLYLTKSLGFSLKEVGIIMSCWGLGSVIGTWVGGKLTDKIGFYHVMKISLLLTGLFFIAMQFITSFLGFCTGIFFVMLVADSFRPAVFVALNAYSKPENKTRSITLIRLAINLGFSVGPAIGGLLIATVGYQSLFWIDGITCFMATLLLIKVLNPKNTEITDDIKVKNPVSVFSDKPFWAFFIAMLIFGFMFLQYFSTVPLYYKDEHLLSESQIGILIGINGFIIFLLEMPLIKWLEDSKFSKESLMLFGTFLLGLSFLVLNISHWSGILVIGIVLMTIGEMIMFPFSNSFALERSKKGNQGEYMAYYSISFSIAHVFAHNSGLQLVDTYGFTQTWNTIIVLSMAGMFFLLILIRLLKRETNQLREKSPIRYSGNKG